MPRTHDGRIYARRHGPTIPRVPEAGGAGQRKVSISRRAARPWSGLLISVIAPRSSGAAGLAAQACGLLGALVGIFTIVMGVGPRSALDVALHVGFIAFLVVGLAVVARGHGETSARLP